MRRSGQWSVVSGQGRLPASLRSPVGWVWLAVTVFVVVQGCKSTALPGEKWYTEGGVVTAFLPVPIRSVQHAAAEALQTDLGYTIVSETTGPQRGSIVARTATDEEAHVETYSKGPGETRVEVYIATVEVSMPAEEILSKIQVRLK